MFRVTCWPLTEKLQTTQVFTGHTIWHYNFIYIYYSEYTHMVEMLENSHCEYYISTMHTHKQTHIYIVYIYIYWMYIYTVYMWLYYSQLYCITRKACIRRIIYKLLFLYVSNDVFSMLKRESVYRVARISWSSCLMFMDFSVVENTRTKCVNDVDVSLHRSVRFIKWGISI